MRKTDDKEKESTIKVDRMKEKSLAVAEGRCRKRILITALQISGELHCNYLLFMEDFLQRPGSCPSSPFFSLWPTQPLPLTSTSGMTNFFSTT